MNKGEWAENVALYRMLASFVFENFEDGEAKVRFRAVGKILPGDDLLTRWLISSDFGIYTAILPHGQHVPRYPANEGFTLISLPPVASIISTADAAMRIMANNKNLKKFNRAVSAPGSPYQTIESVLTSIGMPVSKTTSSHKADLWIVPGGSGATKPKGLNIKCSVCGRTSLLNASAGTNILFEIETSKPTKQATATRSPGALFRFLQTLHGQGTKFTYIEPTNTGPYESFFNTTQQRFAMLLGTDAGMMAAALVLLRYINNWPASLKKNIIKIAALPSSALTDIGTKQFKQAAWTRTMSTLCRQILTGATPSNGHTYVDKGDVPYIMAIGYEAGEATLRALNAPTQHDTIRQFIFDNTELDSPSRSKHDYGYLMNPDGSPAGAVGPRPHDESLIKAWCYNGSIVPPGTYYMRLNFAWRW